MACGILEPQLGIEFWSPDCKGILNHWTPGKSLTYFYWGFPGGSEVKASASNAGNLGSIPGSGRSPRRKWQPTPVFVPGESHGWRSLVGYSPQGRKESDTTERLHFTSLHFPGGSEVKESACNAGDPGSIPGLKRSPGEGNGNPFQYSYLENPMDGGAW